MKREFEWEGKAMGTDYSIAIVCDNFELAQTIYEKIEQDIVYYEQTFSRFLPNSELSIINRDKRKIVSPVFLEVTQKAYELFVKTKGIFNPLVQISRLGYNKSFADLQNENDTENEAVYDIDFSTILIDEEKSFIELQDGQKLDYGGFLKGYLAEKLANKIKKFSDQITGVVVNLGGDIFTIGYDVYNKKFIFNIHNPIYVDQSVNIELFNQGLATSGTYKRTWLNNKQKTHHILDKNGENNPESDIVSVSVINENGAKAEAYTKIFFSMEHNKVLEMLTEKLSFVIIRNNGEVIKNI